MHLTETFPDEGEIWIKEMTLKDQGRVTCSGRATSQDAWKATYGRLRASPATQMLTVQQLRGERPLEFSLHYQWKEVRSDE